MQDIKKPELPKEHVEFIEAVTAAAKKSGMDRFELTYRPSFDTPEIENCFGEVKITYSGTDGRGRPDHRLAINFNANYRLIPDS